MQLSEFGRFLRKYRIDRQIRLKDMADKVGVSSSFLSAVETNKKAIPTGFEQKIADLFEMTAQERKALYRSAETTKTQEVISMPDNDLDRRLIGAFCRNFETLEDQRKKEFIQLLEGFDG